eukprot:m.95975 g.95975  ORF g.95975 m.95975 type:complete len:187 (-) comp13524_c0_seq2:1774-2334(-)
MTANSKADRPKKRKEPEVIVFEDPTAKPKLTHRFEKRARRKFMTSDIAKISTSVADTKQSKSRQDNDEDDIDLRFSEADLLRIAGSQYSKKEKKKWELQQILKSGGRAPKPEKMPLGRLVGIRKKTKERELKALEMAKNMGTHVKKGKKKRAASAPKVAGTKGGRWVDRSSIEDPRFKVCFFSSLT